MQRSSEALSSLIRRPLHDRSLLLVPGRNKKSTAGWACIPIWFSSKGPQRAVLRVIWERGRDLGGDCHPHFIH